MYRKRKPAKLSKSRTTQKVRKSVRLLLRSLPSAKTMKILLAIFVVLSSVGGCTYVSWALIQKRVYQETLVYRTTSLTKQTSVETLFSEEETDDWQLSEWLQKLHIHEYEAMGDEITEDSLDYFKTVVQDTYRNGQQPEKPAKDSDKEQILYLLSIRKEVILPHENTKEAYLEEAEKWNTLYQSSNRPVDLYHSGRAIADALEVGARTFEEMLPNGAEAVYRLETFLTFKNRNINSKQDPVYKNVEDIAFLNGKIYCQLAQSSKIGSEKERRYCSCLLMMAYNCMVHAKSEMSQDHKNYALVIYYVGYTSEEMLKKIPKTSDLYSQISQTAYQHYDEAADLLESGKGYYKEEEAMRKNITNGLDVFQEFAPQENR